MSHRTQLLLEDVQYERLVAEARRKGTSLGALVREAVTLYLGRGERGADALLDVIAIARGDGASGGRDHDHALYGMREEGADGARVRRHERVVRRGRRRRP